MNYRKLRTWRLISITKRINKMDIGNSYNPRIAQENYDAIIIGSGISGQGKLLTHDLLTEGGVFY